jgi:hypothetical protein
LVLAEPTVALTTFDQRVAEIFDVSTGFPDARVHENRGVQSHDVVTLGDNRTPPSLLDVTLEFDAEGAIVPG